MTIAALIYPHQLYDQHPALVGVKHLVLVEEPLYFRQYRFHRQKLILHRASMKRYEKQLKKAGYHVRYVEAHQLTNTQDITCLLKSWNIKAIQITDLNDDWLERRLQTACQEANITLNVQPDPHFLTTTQEIDRFAKGKKKLYFTEFYIGQRQRLNVLLTQGKPVGGQWSFDPENRKKLPKNLRAPVVEFPAEDRFVAEARSYVRVHFQDGIGTDEPFRYPTDHATARQWLANFVEQRLKNFGAYEDAISTKNDILFHSVLTPMLNLGLISPQQVVDAALAQAEHYPLNSIEGFIRQVIGWREFIRLVYRVHGRRQRTTNYWQFTHRIPKAFYDASTGIAPVDHVISQLLRTGYCHHIERLMILGNFMLLCAVHPDDVYQWFMEMFIDAYDWVMVPNIYGMSQHADGGLMTTKPYISGSSYILKMSDFAKGAWAPIWDALYWRFIDIHRDFFSTNPRMAVMVQMANKLGDKLTEHRRVADSYLTKLYG